MIYVSSACSKQKSISLAVKELADHGFKNIELSGGTQYDDHYETQLLELKEAYDLNYLIHNYFPPPQIPFILNLASLDNSIFQKSLDHLRTALDLTRSFGENKFGFHAGFFVDRPVGEIGRKFGKSDLYDQEKAINRFVDGVGCLQNEFKGIELYIENNCYSASNYQVYGSNPPFMLLDFQDYQSLKGEIEFKLLLDIGHLLVTANTCHLDFDREFQGMFENSDYIHISDNDALHDQNLGLTEESRLLQMLNRCDWKQKTISLEIYEGWDALKETYSIVSDLKRRNS